MNIREISKIAGVSPSTVSKVLNAKDASITPQTREKVLEVVREFNYSPYSALRNTGATKSFLLCVVVNEMEPYTDMLHGFMTYAQNVGYKVLILESHGNDRLELKHVDSAIFAMADAILIEPVSGDHIPQLAELEKASTKVFTIAESKVTFDGKELLYTSYESLGYHAAEQLIQSKHTQIKCLCDHASRTASLFYEGYKRCLAAHGIPLIADMLTADTEEVIQHALVMNDASAILCNSPQTAARLYRICTQLSIRVPEDLSILTVGDSRAAELLAPWLSCICAEYESMGKHICAHMIAAAENTVYPEPLSQPGWHISNTNSFCVPGGVFSNRILIVGSINMDILINVNEFPRLGEMQLSTGCSTMPGGKGTNQAIGVARLGGDAILFGKIGNDYEGSQIIGYLRTNNVNTRNVTKSPLSSTGKAFIQVRRGGDSTITILPGANDTLSPEDVLSRESEFIGARICLVQCEISIETVLQATRLAKKHGVMTILKPAALFEANSTLLSTIDIFVPNEKEAELLCPDAQTLEQRAQKFREMGARSVIITLGTRGCYLLSDGISHRFPAGKFNPIDATGASDAFISALAVYMSMHYDIASAVEYANYAAGFSTTRHGVAPSLIDRVTLENYISQVKASDGRD